MKLQSIISGHIKDGNTVAKYTFTLYYLAFPDIFFNFVIMKLKINNKYSNQLPADPDETVRV